MINKEYEEMKAMIAAYRQLIMARLGLSEQEVDDKKGSEHQMTIGRTPFRIKVVGRWEEATHTHLRYYNSEYLFRIIPKDTCLGWLEIGAQMSTHSVEVLPHIRVPETKICHSILYSRDPYPSGLQWWVDNSKMRKPFPPQGLDGKIIYQYPDVVRQAGYGYDEQGRIIVPYDDHNVEGQRIALPHEVGALLNWLYDWDSPEDHKRLGLEM